MPTLVESTSSTTSVGPILSVVVASVNGWPVLEPTLRALDAQPDRDRIEVVVVDRVGGETRRRLREHQPAVVLVEQDEGHSIPLLRHIGVQRARGEIVAILEDHGAVEEGWAARLIEIHRGPWGAVGGTVENGRDGLVNWAAFFCEYTRYMGPVPEGATDDLPGNNIAYKRPHLLRHAHLLKEGKWESWINDRLRADGVPIAATNGAAVRHIKPFEFRHFLIQRFHFSRSFAGMRRADQAISRRLIFGLGSAVLPALLLFRLTRSVLSKRRHVGRYVFCLPLVALFLTVGALGEMVGYLAGPGDSLERVE